MPDVGTHHFLLGVGVSEIDAEDRHETGSRRWGRWGGTETLEEAGSGSPDEPDADAEPEPGGAPEADTERRADFFTEAASRTPLLAIEHAGGLVLVRAGDGGESRMFFAKPGRPAASMRRLRHVLGVLDRFGRRPAKPQCFVDIGAGIGLTTISALRTHGFARAVCIESNPDRAKLLRANLVLNDMDERASVICGNPAGDEIVMRRKKGAWGSWRKLAGEGSAAALAKGAAVTVPTVTIDGLAAEGRLALAEVDLVHVNAIENQADVLRTAKGLKDETSIWLDVDTRALADASGLEMVRIIGERYPRIADLGLHARDAVAADTETIEAVAERYRGDKSPKTAHLLLLGP